MVLAIVFPFFISACNEQQKKESKNENGDLIIGNGQMPNAVKDNSNNLHVVYGSGDSILYSVSFDEGKAFTAPRVIALLP